MIQNEESYETVPTIQREKNLFVFRKESRLKIKDLFRDDEQSYPLFETLI